MPDSITLLLLSSGGFNASNMFGSVGQVGSQALFDDITLTGVAPWAVENLMNHDMKLTISPNPASDNITVRLEKAVKDGMFEICDLQGRIVARYEMPEMNARFSVSSLPAGMYFYRLRSNENTLGGGKFVITR